MNLGMAIKLGRVQRKIKQEELAKLIGVSTSYISLIERNQRVPTIETLENICKALNMKVSQIILLAEALEKDSESWTNIP